MEPNSVDQFSADFIQKVTADTIVGSRPYWRDANLPSALVDKYKKGIVIQETGFADISEYEGGLTARVRYHIVKGKSLELRQSFANYGAWTLPRGCFFKVLDVYKANNHSLVTLLYVPEYAVRYFAKNEHQAEAGIVRTARMRFGDAFHKRTIPELEDEYWRRRTAFPLGIGEDGNFFFQFEEPDTDTRKASSGAFGFIRRLFRRGQN